MTKSVSLFNTLTRKKEEFLPLKAGHVGLYTCGPTVYHYAHIGNLRTYLFEDILVRTLKRAGFEVNHVMNITDVGHLVSDGDHGEDKMEEGARRTGKSIWEIADYYTKVFFSDLGKLNVLKPQIIPKATDHVKEMIELVQSLEERGFTYNTNDGVYFNTEKFPTYKNFAKIVVENLEEGKRVSMGEKKSATDFALWKFSPENEKRQMEWPSPWGKGFPGWHIECSAMAMKYLGQTFDIHCGGIDHIPVHHTNEIAQSEAATGKRFVNYWMHGEFLLEDSGKMSKSKGEFLTLSVLERDGFDPLDYRFLLLQAHYRSSLKFSYEALSAAKSGRETLVQKLREWKDEPDLNLSEIKATNIWVEKFEKAIFDDLNTAEALSILFSLVKDNTLLPKEKKAIALSFDDVLGIRLKEKITEQEAEIPENILSLVAKRDEARKAKDWAESDRLRIELQSLGFTVKDSPTGTKVSK
ncbi:MAG: cysteine--tRNA ligase [Oligoflexia bacterium]|nr:cysteine--tRNA ligase [Oligoflexia bacterium]